VVEFEATEPPYVDEVVIDVVASAADAVAFHRWIARTRSTRRKILIFIPVFVGGLCVLRTGVVGLGLFVLAILGFGSWSGGVFLVRWDRPGRPLRVRIDRYGVRISGATEAEIAWVNTRRFELTAKHLFMHVGALGYVVPLAGINEDDRRRLERIVAEPLEGDRPWRAVADPVPAADPIVVMWQSTRRDTYRLQGLARRAIRGARSSVNIRIWLFRLGVGALSLLATGGLWPSVYLVVLFGFVLPVVLRLIETWKLAHRGGYGLWEVRFDDVGVFATTLTTRWHAPWEVIAAWDISRGYLCLLTTTHSGLAVPLEAITDKARLAELFDARLGAAAQRGSRRAT
jgi:hypothetical protein